MEAVFKVRNNSNVSMEEVLDGKAVFTYQEVSNDVNIFKHQVGLGGRDTSVEADLRYDFMQNIFNQILPRKRSVTDYQMIEEDGIFNADDEKTLARAKGEFLVGVNTSSVNMSEAFSKLMKDYRKESELGVWLDRVIDKDMLVVNTYNSLDKKVNDGNKVTDTGLYELYVNVVEPFVSVMISEAEKYKDSVGKDYPNANTYWVARTGEIVTQGESYCFGCKDKYENFWTLVTRCKEPSSKYLKKTYYKKDDKRNYVTYYGNVVTSTNVNNKYNKNISDYSCSVTNSVANKYPGLYLWEKNAYPYYYSEKNNDASKKDFPQLNPSNWAGIDCSGFVVRVMQVSLENLKVSGDYLVQLPGIWNKKRLVLFNEEEANKNWAADTFFRSQAQIDTTDGEKVMVNYQEYPKDDKKGQIKTAKSLRQGDLVSYEGHVSVIYSDSDVNGNYQVVHAFSWEPGEKDKVSFPWIRKVAVTNNRHKGLGKPIGFGRIKLWD